MLGEGNQAGSERIQCFVIYFDSSNFPLGGARGEGFVAHLVEGIAKFLLGGIAYGSLDWGTGGCSVATFVGGPCHGTVLEQGGGG
jgi:hypothetical protein